MRRRPLLSALPLLLLCLACGMGLEPCDEARPARDRALSTFRASVEDELARDQERWRTAGPGVRRLGADSALSQGIRRKERILTAIGHVEHAWAAGDEATGAAAYDDLDYLSTTRTDWRPVVDAQRDVTHCTE